MAVYKKKKKKKKKKNIFLNKKNKKNTYFVSIQSFLSSYPSRVSPVVVLHIGVKMDSSPTLGKKGTTPMHIENILEEITLLKLSYIPTKCSRESSKPSFCFVLVHCYQVGRYHRA